MHIQRLCGKNTNAKLFHLTTRSQPANNRFEKLMFKKRGREKKCLLIFFVFSPFQELLASYQSVWKMTFLGHSFDCEERKQEGSEHSRREFPVVAMRNWALSSLLVTPLLPRAIHLLCSASFQTKIIKILLRNHGCTAERCLSIIIIVKILKSVSDFSVAFTFFSHFLYITTGINMHCLACEV